MPRITRPTLPSLIAVTPEVASYFPSSASVLRPYNLRYAALSASTSIAAVDIHRFPISLSRTIEARRFGRFNQEVDHFLEPDCRYHNYHHFIAKYGSPAYEQSLADIANGSFGQYSRSGVASNWMFPIAVPVSARRQAGGVSTEWCIPLVEGDDVRFGLQSMRAFLAVPELKGISLRRTLIRTMKTATEAVGKGDRTPVSVLGIRHAQKILVCGRRFMFVTKDGYDSEVYEACLAYDQMSARKSRFSESEVIPTDAG